MRLQERIKEAAATDYILLCCSEYRFRFCSCFSCGAVAHKFREQAEGELPGELCEAQGSGSSGQLIIAPARFAFARDLQVD
jgi:hypothetical protein